MVMEQWDAQKKTLTRYTVDRVAEATNSLVLVPESGERQTLRVTQLDSSWSLYRSRSLEVAEGDRVRALGRELKGAIKAKEPMTVMGLEEDAVRLRAGDRELRLPTDRAVKLTHDYVESTGTGVSAVRTVLAAVGPRGLNKPTLNTLAQSGNDIRIYTPLDAIQAARKVESVAAVRLASDQIRQAAGEDHLETAMRANRDRLMSDIQWGHRPAAGTIHRSTFPSGSAAQRHRYRGHAGNRAPDAGTAPGHREHHRRSGP